jgi:diguanylate cyclase (GGDEF)-like protein
MRQRAEINNAGRVGLVLIAMSVAACAGLIPALSPIFVLIIALVTVALAWPLMGNRAIFLLLPCVGIIPQIGLSGVVLGGLSAWAMMQARAQTPTVDPEQVRLLRAELRDAEHERTLLHRHIQRYPVLLESCLDLSNARELDHFATMLCERTSELLPNITSVRVFLGTANKQTCYAAHDKQSQSQSQSQQNNQAHSKAIEASVEHQYVASEARQLIQRSGRAVRIFIPLRGDRRQADGHEGLRGVLDVALTSDDVGDRLSFELLHALGRLGGLGLGSIDLVSQARSLALHDDLTGLFGQHEFLRRLDEQTALARRQKMPLGIIMCDMDHLKKFNDRYGHAAGDAALRQVAETMRRILPEDTIVCRYGGEEFAALLSGRDLSRLSLIADALCSAIAEQAIMWENKKLQVTASLGVAVLHPDEPPRAMLNRADSACYAAKAAGRNQVARA